MRTDPNNQSPNPCKYWFSWQGQEGTIRYYDKETEKEEHLPLPFWFVVLDRLATVRGWHDPSESGIYSNEVRRTTDEPFTVKAFKMKEPIARGFYADIKDKVKASGGRFNTNLYIAFVGPFDTLEIGSLMLHGAALSAWMEFEKANKKQIYANAVRIAKTEEGKKGSIKFLKPVFELTELEQNLDEQAGKLQEQMRAYLNKYFSRVEHSDAKDELLEQLQEEKEKDEAEDAVPF